MLGKVAKTAALALIATCVMNAGGFNTQAEKDRKALIDYFEAKFKNADKKFFPYSTDDELKNNYAKGLKHADFSIGNYSFNKTGKSQYMDIKEMPPYEEAVEAGEKLYGAKFANGKSFKDCFPQPTIAGDYPMFDEKQGVITLTGAINACLKANGEKPWNMKKGKLAKLEAYFAFSSQEAGKTLNIKIPSQAAADAYARGKKAYYSQRGYLKLSCATCHVQGAGQRVRNEFMSPLLGHLTHFPVHRLKWGGLGTAERRMEGCNKDQGENPHKPKSKWIKELIYFMAYMSNGMKIDGPDIRK